ncbi:MAG: hypothetical protein IPJ84_19240 [Bdellovibrionales bacterium]|nr:hypothetical protein [Bdellovibrionales bacterium]MBK7892906.1 hypothetical protein [Bdellovibrionales bacterium]
MNIIEAREAAMAGKTVIGPNGLAFDKDEFDSDSIGDWSYEMVFGEWKEKREPRVLWGNEYNKTIDGHHVIQLYDSKEFADKNACKDRIACVKFIESLENE